MWDPFGWGPLHDGVPPAVLSLGWRGHGAGTGSAPSKVLGKTRTSWHEFRYFSLPSNLEENYPIIVQT